MGNARSAGLAELDRLVPLIGALTGVEEIMRHEPAFKSAHAALTAGDAAVRGRQIAAIEGCLPPAGAGRVFLLSFLVALANDIRHLQLLQETIAAPPFMLLQRHFFYWQLLTRHSHLRGVAQLEPAVVYAALLEQYRRSANVPGSWIEPADRDADCTVVITNQLLGLQHAPTADCLDYCHVLQARLGKKVVLINTADMPWTLQLPYYDAARFNRVEAYSTLGRLTHRGETFDFYQCRKPMPNLPEIRAIIAMVLERRPSFVLSLGHSNVAADLCAQFMTVATMPFGTDLSRARSNVFVLPRARRESDAAFMQQWQIADEQVVEAEYTFRLPGRSATVRREELGLPTDAYVIAVVGNRLAEEVTDDVAANLAALLAAVPAAFIAFVGTFPSYDRLARFRPIFAGRSAFLGYHTDVLAVYEHCDAYFNPPRYGGGSSAAFALAMGLPVFTENAGDVASIAGAPFVFASFDAIAAFIETAVDNSELRQQWSAAARRRFEQISDREGMLRTIVEGAAARAALRVLGA